MQKIEVPQFDVNNLTLEQRAELSKQLAEAQAVNLSVEVDASAEAAKNKLELPPIEKSAEAAVKTNIPADLSSARSQPPTGELVKDDRQPAENLSNLLELVQEGQLITKAGKPLTDLNAFMDNLNKRLANPKPDDLDLKKE